MFKSVRSLGLFSVIISLCFSHTTAQAQEHKSESLSVNLAIYNQNLGLVRDIRRLELKSGINIVRLLDIATGIDPTSVLLKSLTAPNSLVVQEQNYQYNLLNPPSILCRSVGKMVKFRHYVPSGVTQEVSGILLNAPQVTVADSNGNNSIQSQDLVIKTSSGIVLNPSGEVELAELPTGLVSAPSLLYKLNTDQTGQQELELTYLTTGLSWGSNYVLAINSDDTKGDITSWVTIDNQSGTSYKHAILTLIAGDVHRVDDNAPRPMMTMAMAVPRAPQFQEQSAGDYHQYKLNTQADINENETKQLNLFDTTQVALQKNFVFEPSTWSNAPWSENDKSSIKIKLELENSKSTGLGVPLPKGKIRVYRHNSDGSLLFLGEDFINHTPTGEKIHLTVGSAFDLVGEQKQVSQQQVSPRIQRQSFEVTLRNHKDTDVNIKVVEHADGTWKINSSSLPYTKTNARTFQFTVKVPANGEVKLSYEIESKNS